MRVVQGRNVNDLYHNGIRLLLDEGQKDSSRDGDVLVMPSPVMSVYHAPTERVLFDEKRDANPFFHLMESLWMLAGRNDGKWLDSYVADFSSRYAEADGRIHGAYGHRWRNHWEHCDQLDMVVQRLRANPKDRRVVITMWDPYYDLGEPHEEMPKDLPCNTQIYPRIVENPEKGLKFLDFTVTCRSNDAVWGAYGANAVHFTILQEYIAAGVGADVGMFYQLSNNFHLYTGRTKGIELPKKKPADKYGRGIMPYPLVKDFDSFYGEVRAFCDGKASGFKNDFLENVAAPMRHVAQVWRKYGAGPAGEQTDWIKGADWRLAAEMWLKRRVKHAS